MRLHVQRMAAAAAAAAASGATTAASSGGATLSAALRDRGVRWVLAGWGVFTVENLVLSEYRSEIRRSWGGSGGHSAYQSLYSLLSATTLGSTILAYWRFARFGVEIRSVPAPLPFRFCAFALRATGFFALGQLAPPVNFGAASIALGLSTPSMELPAEVRGAMGCPFDMNAYKDRGEVFGITRVTRRPELFGLLAMGLGGTLLSTTATQVAFYGVGPVVCFSLLALHSERTQRKAGEFSETREAQTSLFPFWAFLDGRQSFSALLEDVDPVNACTAVGLAGLAALRPPWLRWVR